MKKILSNYRYYVLTALGCIAIFGLFAVPVEMLPFLTWLYVLVSSKVIGIIAGYALYRLTEHWEEQGTIPELTDALDSL